MAAHELARALLKIKGLNSRNPQMIRMFRRYGRILYLRRVTGSNNIEYTYLRYENCCSG